MFACQKTLENTEGAIKKGQSRETGKIGYTSRRETNKQKHKQTQTGINKTCPFYKQLEVKYELNVARTQDNIPLMISTTSIHYLNMECFLCLSNYGNISL